MSSTSQQKKIKIKPYFHLSESQKTTAKFYANQKR